MCGGRIHSLLDVFVNRVPCWIDVQYAGDVDVGDFSSVSQFTLLIYVDINCYKCYI